MIHALLLALATAHAPAAADAPEAALRAAYREPASLQRPWPAVDDGMHGERHVCARIDEPSAVQLAVCTDYDDAGAVDSGRVDLWRLERTGNAWRIAARELRIETGAMGTAGDVERMALGSGRDVFLLHSGYANQGWGSDDVMLYAADGAGFRSLLQYRAQVSNGGTCDAATDRACARRRVDLECTLVPDRGAAASTAFPGLTLHVRGMRDGHNVIDDIRIPYTAAHGYAVPRDVLKARGCDHGY